MRIAICDDCQSDRSLLAGFVERFFAADHAALTLAQYASGEELLQALAGADFDLVFLDIYMRGQNGMEAARVMRTRSYRGAIVFTTSSKDFAVEGYEVDAVYYLVKPYTYAQLCTAMKKAAQQPVETRCLAVSVGRMHRDVPLHDILWMEAGDHCCFLHTRAETLRAGALLSQVDKELADEPRFVRCNRGIVANADHILRCDGEFVYLDNGDRLQMNLRNAARIRQQIHDYRWSRLRDTL